MEVLQEPASPELSTSPSSSPSTPSPAVAPTATKVQVECDRAWNLFKLGHLNLLISSNGLQLTSESCCFTSNCPFWPKCSELWRGTPSSTSEEKVVHLEVRPEYLQPWGCEELTEDEIFVSALGAHLASPKSPTILRCESVEFILF